MNEYLKNENSLAPYMVFPRFLLDAGINEYTPAGQGKALP